jgi:hypothetical protein
MGAGKATLVVDATGFNDQTWFRPAPVSMARLCVVERYTPVSPEVLIMRPLSRPNGVLRPWKISMPLYRRIEKICN